jgi:hypothetical protein
MLFRTLKQNNFYFLFFAILFGSFLFFGNVNNVSAASCSCVASSGTTASVGDKASIEACQANCYNHFNSSDVQYSFGGSALANISQSVVDAYNTANGVNVATGSVKDDVTTLSIPDQKNEDICTKKNWISGNFVNCLLLGVLRFAGFLLAMANVLFEWCVDTKNWDLIFNNTAIYGAWEIIRDLLNISFILVLLYTAFTIIFQVGAPGKGTLLTIVLMALLVNFSFPITRFIIDMSNSLMYTIINTLDFGNGVGGGASKAIGSFTDNSNIDKIIKPDGIPGIAELLTAIIFIFILAITYLATGLMFIIRMVSLSILLIFSPIAFVSKILPETKKYSSSWWNDLFNNAIFGPAMMMGIYVATKMMSNQMGFSNFYSKASDQSGNPAIIATMAWFSIPIIILWTVMGTAKKFSIAGAGVVMGQANKLLNMPKNMANYGWKASGIPGGAKKGWADARKSGKLFGTKIIGLKDNQESRETRLAGLVSGGGAGLKKAKEGMAKKGFDEDTKKSSEGLESETTTVLINHIDPATATGAANIRAAKDPANRDAAIKYAGHYKQLLSDPARMDEYKNGIRNASTAQANLDATAGVAAVSAQLQTAAEASANAAGLIPGSTEWRAAVIQARSQAETAVRTEAFQRSLESSVTAAITRLRNNYKDIRKVHTDIT